MGLDIRIQVDATPTDAELAQATAYFTARSDIGYDLGEGILFRTEDGKIELSSLDRFYGPGYERGPWADIHAAILTLQAAFPGCPVYYGSDCDDELMECTPDMLRAMWDHFLSSEGDGYRRNMSPFRVTR